MKKGKPEENVSKRINKYIEPCQNELITVLKQTVINYDFAAKAALIAALNELSALPADPVSITIGIMLPPDEKPQDAGAILEQLSELAEKKAVPITNIDVTTRDINRAVVSVMLTGRKNTAKAKPNEVRDIVIAGYVAGLGTALMAELKTDKLKGIFSEPFIKGASDFKDNLLIDNIVKIAFAEGAEYVFPFSEGGIFAGFWEMAEALKCGMSIDVRKIPIKQETIELSEVFQINPYLIDSTGAAMIVIPNGNELVKELALNGINAALVGSLKEGKERILLNDGEIRYIDRPKEDEIFKLLENN